MCVHCLLYTESGRALLDIVSTGVDVVEGTLAQQGRSVIKGYSIFDFRGGLFFSGWTPPPPVFFLLKNVVGGVCRGGTQIYVARNSCVLAI